MINKVFTKIEFYFNKKGVIILSFLVSLYILGHFADKYYGYTTKDKTFTNICSDGTGYYAYLPQYIIYPQYKHFGFQEIVQKKHPIRSLFPMWNIHGQNKRVDKYYVGYALLNSPFFLTTHLYHKIVYGEGDGYSLGYRISITIGALCFWLFGSIFIFKFLHFFDVKPIYRMITIVLLAFGTNLNFYTSIYSTFSHVTSFFLIACFLYFAKRLALNITRKNIILFALLISAIYITRPVNVLILLIVPFLFSSLKEFKEKLILLIKNHKLSLFFAISVMLIVVSIQLWNTYDQIGEIKMNTYSDEWFSEWKTPHFGDVLFGYNKGFFVFAPIMFLMFPGYYYLFKKERNLFFGVIVTSIIVVYFVASWHAWEYGVGFGMRPLIDFLPLFCIPIAFLFNEINKFLRPFLIIVSIGLIYVYQFFQYQILNSILDVGEIKKDYFWKVFLQDDERFRWSYAFEFEKIDKSNLKIDKVFKIDQSKSQYLLDKSITISNKANSPIITLYKDSLRNSDEIAFELNFLIKIADEKDNPQVLVEYFSKKEVIKKSQFILGAELNDIQKYEKLNLEIFPNLKYGQIDSMKIHFYTFSGKSNSKNIQLVKYKNRKN